MLIRYHIMEIMGFNISYKSINYVVFLLCRINILTFIIINFINYILLKLFIFLNLKMFFYKLYAIMIIINLQFNHNICYSLCPSSSKEHNIIPFFLFLF